MSSCSIHSILLLRVAAAEKLRSRIGNGSIPIADIHTSDLRVSHVAIVNSHVAYGSHHEIRVLNLNLRCCGGDFNLLSGGAFITLVV